MRARHADPSLMPPSLADHNAIAADGARMAAIADGDQRAFQALMQEEGPRLLRLAASLLRSAAEAEEVTQDAFLRLWQASESWIPQARVGTWLHRVVYRLAIDRIRARRPNVGVEEIEDALPSGDPDPEAMMVARQRQEIIDWALDQLPARGRTAIVLAHFQGLPQAEAASVLDLSEEAYESLLARSRRRLKGLVNAKA